MEIETLNIICDEIFVGTMNFIYVDKGLVAFFIFYGLFLKRVVISILVTSVIMSILLLYQTKRLAVFTCLLPINIPHFLDLEQPFNFERWDTVTLVITLTDVSVIITVCLAMMIAIYLLIKGRTVEKKGYLRLYTYFALRECKENKIKQEGEKRLYIGFALNITCLLALCAMLDGGSILELARWLNYHDLANFLKQEAILSRVYLLPVSSFISHVLQVLYEGYQWGKGWILTKKGITTYQLVDLTLFFFLPILFFPLYLKKPWPVTDNIYNYQFNWLPSLISIIKSLTYAEMIFVGAVLMGILGVISVIVGRQVRKKTTKELWQSLVSLVFVISVVLRVDNLFLMMLDTSFVTNLLLLLVNLGILGTNPLGTPIIPTRMPPINMMNDPRLGGHRSGRLGLPPSQQGGGVNPGSLLDHVSPPPQEVDHANSSTLVPERTLGYLPIGRDYLTALRYFPGLELVFQLRVIYNSELGQVFPDFFVNTLVQKNRDIMLTLAKTNDLSFYCYTQRWYFLHSILHNLHTQGFPDRVINELLHGNRSLTRVLYQCTLCEMETRKLVEEYCENSTAVVNASLNELHQLDIMQQPFDRRLLNLLTIPQRERFFEFIYPIKERQMIFNSALKSALGLVNVQNHEILTLYGRYFYTSSNKFYSEIVVHSNNRLRLVKNLSLTAPQAMVDLEFNNLSHQIKQKVDCLVKFNTERMSLLDSENQIRSIEVLKTNQELERIRR